MKINKKIKTEKNKREEYKLNLSKKAFDDLLCTLEFCKGEWNLTETGKIMLNKLRKEA